MVLLSKRKFRSGLQIFATYQIQELKTFQRFH